MVSALLGVVVGHGLGSDGPPEPRAQDAASPAGPARPGEGSRALLEEIAAELRALRAASLLVPPSEPAPAAAQPPGEAPVEAPVQDPAPPPGRTPVPVEAQGPAPLHPELREWMERVEQRLAVVASGAGAASSLRLPAPGFPASEPPLPAVGDPEQEAFARSHFLWSLQDVLDVYGLPDVVHPDGDGVEWEYKYPEGSPLGDVHFVFHDGLCVSQFAH